MSTAVQDQILNELKQLTDICDVLKTLQIAIGFLSSAGGLPSMLISEYLDTGLKLSRKDGLKSAKVRNICAKLSSVSRQSILKVIFRVGHAISRQSLRVGQHTSCM